MSVDPATERLEQAEFNFQDMSLEEQKSEEGRLTLGMIIAILMTCIKEDPANEELKEKKKAYRALLKEYTREFFVSQGVPEWDLRDLSDDGFD